MNTIGFEGKKEYIPDYKERVKVLNTIIQDTDFVNELSNGDFTFRELSRDRSILYYVTLSILVKYYRGAGCVITPWVCRTHEELTENTIFTGIEIRKDSDAFNLGLKTLIGLEEMDLFQGYKELDKVPELLDFYDIFCKLDSK